MLWICIISVLPEIIFGQILEENLNFINVKSKVCARMVGVSKPLDCRVIEGNKNHTNILPRHCQEIFEIGHNASGIYEIQPIINVKPIMVYCDMKIRKGGWTVIQNRFDGSEDFYKLWRDYKFGFGDLQGEFWIGLENIYHLTGMDLRNELLLEITDRDGKKFHFHYNVFAIGPEKEGYILNSLGDFSGDAGDALIYHLNQKFSTQDMDQDEHKTNNCAQEHKGGWWFKYCANSNLNGKFMNLPKETLEGLTWYHIRNSHEYLYSGSRMLIKPRESAEILPDFQ